MAIVLVNGRIVGRVLNCPECGCRFQLETDDTPAIRLDIDGQPPHLWFECPQCQASVELPNA